jgi:hypothetical protein
MNSLERCSVLEKTVSTDFFFYLIIVAPVSPVSLLQHPDSHATLPTATDVRVCA